MLKLGPEMYKLRTSLLLIAIADQRASLKNVKRELKSDNQWPFWFKSKCWEYLELALVINVWEDEWNESDYEYFGII